MQEDNPDAVEEREKPPVTSSLSEAEQLTASWWSAKVTHHLHAYHRIQLHMAPESVVVIQYSMPHRACCC